ncbi:MAG: adenosine deaminase [Actinomycetales bacterium]|nr:adenosine deaminase [Actinomycetales bacterium]
MSIDEESVRALPKVLLHDHLDGGLRPQTITEIAAESGLELPAQGAEALGAWFVSAAGSWFTDGVETGSLETYLETFSVTTAVMQTEEQLYRVAKESVLDLAADGVVYAEQRYAPEQHTAKGLSLQAVVDAVQAGLTDGVHEAEAAGRFIRVGQLVTAMRQNDLWDEIADLALANRDNGVVGFDLAGPENGFPPDRIPAALAKLREAHFPVTLHAGEAAGLDSIAAALHRGGALRLGHGVRIMDDIEVPDLPGANVDELAAGARLGRLAHWVRDNQVPLELCPTSNTQTGAATSIAAHPITLLRHLGFAVTVNTDNRLQSGTSMTREMHQLVTEAGWTLDDLRDVTLDAAWNTFIHFDERGDLVEQVILPAYEGSDTDT